MKLILVVTLILIGGFGTSSAMDNKCEAQDLNAMMVHLRHLRTEFKQFKENSSKEINTLKHADDEKAKEIKRLNATLLNKTSQIEEQAEEINTLKGLVEAKQTTPLVAFVVRHKYMNNSCTYKLPFKTIVLNEGNAFNTTTSYFRAPYAGLYSLTVQLCENNGYSFFVYSNTYNKTYGASRNYYSGCSSLSTVTKLVSGEEIYVQFEKCASIYKDEDFWTMFSGVLLHLSP